MEEWSAVMDSQYEISSHPGRVMIDGGSLYLDLDLTSKTLRRRAGLPEPRAQAFGSYWGWRATRRASDADGVVQLEDIETGDVILHGDEGFVVPDIDGDGLPDLHGGHFVHLQRGAAWLPTAYPPFQSEWNYYRLLPVGDLTGDGRADLLIADDTDWDIGVWGLAFFRGGYLQLHEGTDDGYQPMPAWTLSVDTPIASAFATQLDADPELELFMIGADDWYETSGEPSAAAILTIDLSTGEPVANRPYELVDSTAGPGRPAFAHPLGDLDGDGLDEIVLFMSAAPMDPASEPWPIAHCLTSEAGWDPDQPLWTLGIPAGVWADPELGLVADVDGDGDRDVVTVYHTILADPNETVVQVWYPDYPIEPVETGDTGDTGTPSTTDTGTPPYETPDDTAEPTTTTDDTTAISPSDPEPKGCACDASPRFPLSPFARRRAGGSR